MQLQNYDENNYSLTDKYLLYRTRTRVGKRLQEIYFIYSENGEIYWISKNRCIISLFSTKCHLFDNSIPFFSNNMFSINQTPKFKYPPQLTKVSTTHLMKYLNKRELQGLIIKLRKTHCVLQTDVNRRCVISRRIILWLNKPHGTYKFLWYSEGRHTKPRQISVATVPHCDVSGHESYAVVSSLVHGKNRNGPRERNYRNIAETLRPVRSSVLISWAGIA